MNADEAGIQKRTQSEKKRYTGFRSIIYIEAAQ